MAVLAFTFFFGRFGEEECVLVEIFVTDLSFLVREGIVFSQVTHDIVLKGNALDIPLS